MNLAIKVRDCRYAKGWGPDELASRAEISRTALYQIESGKTGLPRAGTLRRIASALEVSMDELLGHTEGSSLAGTASLARSVLDHHAVMGRPREFGDWIPSEGGPLAVPSQSPYANQAYHVARDEHRNDDQRLALDSQRIRTSFAPESLLLRE